MTGLLITFLIFTGGELNTCFLIGITHYDRLEGYFRIFLVSPLKGKLRKNKFRVCINLGAILVSAIFIVMADVVIFYRNSLFTLCKTTFYRWASICTMDVFTVLYFLPLILVIS